MSEVTITVPKPRLLAAVSVAQAKDDVRFYLNCTRIEADGRMVATDGIVMSVAKPEEPADYSAWAAKVVGIDISGALRTALKSALAVTLRTMPDTTDVMATVLFSGSRANKTFVVASVRNATYPLWRDVVPKGLMPRADGGFVAGSESVWSKAVQTAKMLSRISNHNTGIATYRGMDADDGAAVLLYGEEYDLFTVAMPMTGHDGTPPMFNPEYIAGEKPEEKPDNMPVPHGDRHAA